MTSLESRREQLRQEIDGDEQHLRDALGQLKDSLQAKVDVGHRASRRPYQVLALAIGAGFLLGAWPRDAGEGISNALEMFHGDG